MDRKDWVWVVVKVLGLYIGTEALQTVPSLLMILTSHGAGQAALGLFSSFLIKAGLSFYLLKSGRLIFRLIGINPDPSAPSWDAGDVALILLAQIQLGGPLGAQLVVSG